MAPLQTSSNAHDRRRDQTERSGGLRGPRLAWSQAAMATFHAGDECRIVFSFCAELAGTLRHILRCEGPRVLRDAVLSSMLRIRLVGLLVLDSHQMQLPMEIPMSDQSRAEVTARGREREREGESARAVHLMGRDWPFDSCLLVQQGGRGVVGSCQCAV